MRNNFLKICVYVVLVVHWSGAARIFSYQPLAYDTHQGVFHVLTRALARRGHAVLALTARPLPRPDHNVTEIDVHDMSYSAWDKIIDNVSKRLDTFTFLSFKHYAPIFGVDIYKKLDLQLRHPQMRNLIEDQSAKFDLILGEAALSLGVLPSARFPAPVVLVSAAAVTANVLRLVGAETDPCYCPDYLFAVDKHSFWQKLYYFYDITSIIIFYRKKDDAFIKKHFGEGVPSFKESSKQVGMLFLNVHRYLDYNRPVPVGSMLYMGGFHLEAPRDLPRDLEAYLSGSARGVVLINFGSRLRPSRLPAFTLRAMLAALAQLPYDFLWKWDANELPGKPDNVRIERSLPQNDLLYHHNVRALITHGGQLSMHEALAAGVPVVCLPVYPDHRGSARHYERLGFGVHVPLDDLDSGRFKDGVLAVVEDHRYREAARRVARIVSDVREAPLRTAERWAARWAERAPAHARLTRCPRADATLLTVYMLDVAFAATALLILATVAITFAVKRLITFAHSRTWTAVDNVTIK